MALVIDIQERLLPHISGHAEMMKHIGILLEGMKTLQIPVLLTEQYRKGLGETVQGVREHLEEFTPMEKMAFSCCDDNAFSLALETQAKKKCGDLWNRNTCVCAADHDRSAGERVSTGCDRGLHLVEKAWR